MIERLKKIWSGIWPFGLILLLAWTIWSNYMFTSMYFEQKVIQRAQQLIQQAQEQQGAQQQRPMVNQGTVNKAPQIPEKAAVPGEK